MCFMMDPNLGKHVCYVQFPQRFDGIDRNDRYANRNTVFFDVSILTLLRMILLMLSDFCFCFYSCAVCVWVNLFWYAMFIPEQINLRGLDGIQGPVYVGTGCVFNRFQLG